MPPLKEAISPTAQTCSSVAERIRWSTCRWRKHENEAMSMVHPPKYISRFWTSNIWWVKCLDMPLLFCDHILSYIQYTVQLYNYHATRSAESPWHNHLHRPSKAIHPALMPPRPPNSKPHISASSWRGLTPAPTINIVDSSVSSNRGEVRKTWLYWITSSTEAYLSRWSLFWILLRRLRPCVLSSFGACKLGEWHGLQRKPESTQSVPQVHLCGNSNLLGGNQNMMCILIKCMGTVHYSIQVMLEG